MDPNTFRLMSVKAGGSLPGLPATITTFNSDIYTQTASRPGETAGPSITLTWNVINSSSVSIDQNIGFVGASGSITLMGFVGGPVTYRLSAEGNDGDTISAVVTVNWICHSCSLAQRLRGQCAPGCF